MLESIDFPLVLPVGDLSEVVQGRNQKGEKEWIRKDKEGQGGIRRVKECPFHSDVLSEFVSNYVFIPL